MPPRPGAWRRPACRRAQTRRSGRCSPVPPPRTAPVRPGQKGPLCWPKGGCACGLQHRSGARGAHLRAGKSRPWRIMLVPMGEVVELQKKKAATRKTAGKPPRRRARRSRTALVLGGGGFTGGVYQIGALRALDLLAVNRTVNQFDVYVGTSAGSFVGSLVANGVTPEEMMRVVNQQVPTPFRDINMGTVLKPNYFDFAKALAVMPLRAAGVVRELATNIANVGLMDLVFGLAEGLPSGMYSAEGIERYLRE